MSNKYNLTTQPYKGTRDFYPEDFAKQKYLFDIYREVCLKYGYDEYNGPMIESFDLYAAKTGEEIVNNELYWFIDRGDRKVAIRPEMTPTVARMIAARIQELPKPIRWFNIANFMRNEAPQRGRLREFWQLNFDLFGVESLDGEVEMLLICRDIFTKLGATKKMFECRVNNRKLLKSFFYKIGLDSEGEQQYKVSKAIDKKDKISKEDFEQILEAAGCTDDQINKISLYINSDLGEVAEFVGKEDEGYQELITLFELLKIEGGFDFVKFVPGLMRGFDYYTGIVFEFFDLSSENKRSLFGGGRYDDLVGIFNDQKLPAVGMAPGEVGMLDFMDTYGLTPAYKSETDILVTVMDEVSKSYSLEIANRLRRQGYKVATYLNVDRLDKQLKYADQKNINFVVIAGSDEIVKQTFKLKYMKERSEREVRLDEIDTLSLT